MKTRIMMTILATTAVIGCGQLPGDLERTKDAGGKTTEASSAVSADDQSSNQLYLQDAEESAVQDSPADEPEDTSIKDDLKADRLDALTAFVMERLDSDNSGDLSLDEVLAGPSKRADEKGLTADVKAAKLAKVTEEFTKYAGEDAKLSSDELKTLIKAIGPRIARHRHCHHKGEHGKRMKQSWDDIVAKYDTDKDGKLSQAEFEAMRADRHGKGGSDEAKAEDNDSDKTDTKADPETKATEPVATEATP